MLNVKRTVLIISIALLAGCSQSPLSKLKADKEYPFMDNAYWKNQEQENPTLWKQAVTYCQANQTKPNCDPVLIRIHVEDGASKFTGNFGGDPVTLPWETKKSWQSKN